MLPRVTDIAVADVAAADINVGDGRSGLTMQLHPFRPHEASEMLPRLRPAERAVVYGVAGGMPLYLSWWDQGAPIRDNLMRLACTPDGRMLVEGDLVLATEAGHGEHMAAVLQAFFLGVLSPFRGEIDRGLGKTIINAVVGGIDDHMGGAWEEAFRDHLRLRAVEGGLGRDDVVAVGSWWRDGGSQIDAVGLAGRSRVPFLVGEAKWSKRVNAARIKAGLTVKAGDLVSAPESLRYVVCGREQVEHADPETLIITAAEIFSDRQSSPA